MKPKVYGLTDVGRRRENNQDQLLVDEQRDVYAIAKEELTPVLTEINSLESRLARLQEKLEDMDAPYTPGRKLQIGNN